MKSSKTDKSRAAVLITIVIVSLLILIVSPIVTIWALNILFGLAIPYNIYTWAASVWLTSLLIGNKLR